MINILIMDRSRTNRQKISHYLEDFKSAFKIIGDAANSEQAERLIKKRDIDLVIGDDTTTGKSGLQLFNDLRDSYPGLHMILFSTSDLYAESKETLSKGRVDYLTAPARKGDILNSLNRMAHMIDASKQQAAHAKSLRYTYEDNMLHFRERFLMNLIYGSIRNSTHIYEQLNYFHIDHDNAFTVAVFKIDDYRRYQLALDEDEQQFLIFKVYSLLEKEMAANDSGLAFISRFDEVTLLYTTQSDLTTIIDHCRKLHTLINDTLELQGTMGIGRTYQDSQQIHLSYNQAIDAVLEHNYLGKNTLIHINYVSGMKDLTYAYGPELEYMVIKYALSGQLEPCLKTLDKVLTAISNTDDYDRVFYLSFIKKSLYHLYRDGYAYEYRLEDHLKANMPADDLLSVIDAESAFDYLKKALTLITAYIIDEKINQDQDLLEHTLKYVQAYHTSRISLVSAAQYLLTTPKHLEDIIYSVYEKSFYDFCMMVRLENAKELLIHTKQSTAEVATAVGFTNTEYFVAIFKQHTNETPSEYRHQNKDTSDLPITLAKPITVNRFPRRLR